MSWPLNWLRRLFPGRDVIYPAEACGGGNDCKACPLFWCWDCLHFRPWCFGAADDHLDLCDNCWHAETITRSVRP